LSSPLSCADFDAALVPAGSFAGGVGVSEAGAMVAANAAELAALGGAGSPSSGAIDRR
jgi:hypothetical protein